MWHAKWDRWKEGDDFIEEHIGNCQPWRMKGWIQNHVVKGCVGVRVWFFVKMSPSTSVSQ
jgi:hypothetical protein